MPGDEIIVIRSAEDVVNALDRYDALERKSIGDAFHRRALRDYTYAQRALKAKQAFAECLERRKPTVHRQEYLLEERA